ncbi:MAG: RidA family protein [Alphaproteobacteria bacterium]|nr:RidA family protein [Alphaproteobacteria bacterium]MDP6564098.1 RidA family protein [Alphaproteobacteria bacterium]MDP6816270.1 RidA family protein [Alphaproteobacteria bacterium]
MTARAVQPKQFPWYDYSRYSFSLALAAGQGVYVSGHTGSEFDPTTRKMVIKGGMAEQCRTAYTKIGAILEGAGMSHGDVVRMVEYVRVDGLAHYAEAAQVRQEVFGAHRPAVNTVPVKALLRPDALIELEATAGPVGAETGFSDGGPVARESAGVVFLPTIQAVDAAGNIIGAGDVVGQTQAIFEKAAEMLAALGLGFDRVVKTLDYLTPAALADYRNTGRVRKQFLGPVYPCAAGILMPGLLHPEALIQYDFIATRDDPVAINPGWSRYDKLTYSPGVRAGDLLFLSGQGALDPETQIMLFDGDVVAQAEYTYENIIKVVRAAGGGPEHLAKTIEYVTPAALPRYREVAGVRSKLLRGPLPASTGLICEALLRPEMLIEVDPFAVLA